MSNNHTGNVLNSITQEEHDGDLNAKRVNIVAGSLSGGQVTISVGSAVTIYAVVNTAAAGQASVVVDGPVAIKGNLTLSDSKSFIGLVSVSGFSNPMPVSQFGNWNVGILGNVTLSDSKNFIGLVSIGGGILNTITAVTDITNPVAIKGNLTLSDSKTFIGLTTTTLGASPAFVGIVTIANSNIRSIDGNITLSDAKTFIGLTTTIAINAGTNKTLIPLPIGLGNNSLSTVAIPTNANTIKATNLVLNSNVTTEIAIKSGVTYLTGNATIGITIFPGGGFVLPGSVDSPSWMGCPSGALVIEKRDPGGTVSKVGGQVIYFQE